MNCIFICIFKEIKYVDIFYLLLESLLIYGNLKDNINIVVYTSTQFMNIIKTHHLFNDNLIKFEINDTYDSVYKSCRSRLDLFYLSCVTNYSKFLYLDTDILIKDDINKVFEICKEDILYVLEEGVIDCMNDYWGNILFGDEVNNYNDKTAFTSGILLFNNCKKVSDLFNNINQDMIDRPYDFHCQDQPYIIYNAFKNNCYNNKILKTFAVNNDNNIYSDKVIHHFPGGPGISGKKIVLMSLFLNKLKQINLNNEFFENKNNNFIKNKRYTWGNSTITFLDNFEMCAFGKGYYEIIDKYSVISYFGERKHFIIFNSDYTAFTSTRDDDLEILNGEIVVQNN